MSRSENLVLNLYPYKDPGPIRDGTKEIQSSETEHCLSEDMSLVYNQVDQSVICISKVFQKGFQKSSTYTRKYKRIEKKKKMPKNLLILYKNIFFLMFSFHRLKHELKTSDL